MLTHTLLQYGYPKTWEEYVHRLGRTGRAGYEGLGLLVLFPFETKNLPALRRRGLKQNKRIEAVFTALSNEDYLLESARAMIGNGHSVLTPAAETAYLSLLGYYSARAGALGISGDQVLESAASFISASGLRVRPEVSSTLLDELKLSKGRHLPN